MGESKLHLLLLERKGVDKEKIEAYFRQRSSVVDTWETEIVAKGGIYQDREYSLKHCPLGDGYEVVHLLLLNFRFPKAPKYFGYLFVAKDNISDWDEAGNIESDSWSEYRTLWKEVKANACSY